MTSKPSANGSQTGVGKEKQEKTLQQMADEYDFTKDLQANSFLDIKDTASAWCLAQVTQLSADTIRVHYDGWSDKYNEVS